MKQDVRLYINDKLVDFSNELSMPFIYQLEDTNNPTAVKNSWTKSITIAGTDNNNKIFGEIYNLDRQQLYSNSYITGVYFNPSFRTPFSIYRNGELIESGYMQLNNITLKNKIVNYNITLYGGLGDFFYKLKYNSDSTPLTLADLRFGVENTSSDNEFNFTINKEWIKRCWDNIDSNVKNPEYFINFIPAENGIYENFDNNKVLINFYNNKAFTQSAVTVDGTTYSTHNGYALAQLNKELDEWEMCSLRSTQQRPALRVKGFIDAICDPINNGGYNVELDTDFFNENNPYFQDAFIALPLLQSSFDFESETEGEEGKLIASGDTWVGTKDGSWDRDSQFALYPQSPIKANEYGIIDISQYPVSTFFNFSVDFQLFFTPTSATTADIYMSAAFANKGVAPRLNSVLAQIYVYEMDYPYRTVGFSDIYNFTNNTTAGTYVPTDDDFVKGTGANIKTVLGKFVYDVSSGKHYFRTNNGGNNTFRIVAENVSRSNVNLGAYLVLHISGDEQYCFTKTPQQNVNMLFTTTGYFTTKVDGNTSVASARWDGESILTNTPITKQKLLKTENTPLDYLLSYTKQFGLYFSQDIVTKTIKIQQRNNFFTGDIIDINDRIDYSKDVTIKPIVFDKKFYRLANEGDSYYLNKYKKEYGVDYGQKRINTNYNFNADTEDMLKDNVYNNALSVVDSSNYYRSFYNSSGNSVPAFAVDNLTYQLYYLNRTQKTDVDVYGYDVIDLTKTKKWNSKTGYDFTDKLAFYNYDNNVKNLAEIDSCLVFYNGKITPTAEDGTIIPIWLTDDVQEMYELGDKSCHLYTESEYNSRNQRIAYKLNQIPKFSRYKTAGNNIVASMDYAVPKQFYLFNTTYEDSATIYSKYMADFYADQLDINTKKVTAYVNLNGLVINSDSLRNFYYFNNCIWILNKIDGYDVNNFNTVKCEFIKVNDVSNYTKQLGL